ncbi:MAG: 2-keto-4-pentenoate hydratase [Pseudomonadales bacterium]
MTRPQASRYSIAALCFLLLEGCAPHYYQESAGEIYRARQQAQLAPLVSTSHPALNVENAYVVQRALVKKFQQDSAIVGYKGGLTGIGAAQKFGLREPVVGALFESGKITDDQATPRIARSGFRQLMLELELGFVFSKPVTQRLKSIEALKSRVAHIVPAIELPDLGFEDMPNFKGVDLVANNVSAHSFILGRPLPADTPFDKLVVKLYRGDELIVSGVGSDASPNQWQAALWLCNKLLALGYRVKEGQVLLTGALGKMVPGAAGVYRAHYGDLQVLEFEVR